MRSRHVLVTAVAFSLCCLPRAAGAQASLQPGDVVNGYTGVTFDTRSHAYDYLVDGSLAQHDPARKMYKTVEAAYEAAPAGTPGRPTVIGIRPNVYLLPGSGPNTGLTITKDDITLVGLTNDRRTVVIADNRGNQQGAGPLGASNNGFTMIVKANGFTAMNLTILNYCNIDYDYPGTPGRSLKKRSDVITQAVALQSQGDRHVYSHVAVLSRLDTWFLSTTRAYLTHVYVEGTEDFIGGGEISLWEDSEIRTYWPKGILFTRGAVFVRTVFKAVQGMEFYKVIGEPIALIDCVVPVSTREARVAWMGWKVPLRQNAYSLTYRTTDVSGRPATIADGLSDPSTFNLSREIGAREARAFNAWNLLRATPSGVDDGWDPAGARNAHDNLALGEQVFRIAMTNGTPSIRTGGASATIEVKVSPARAQGVAIAWTTASPLVTLGSTVGDRVTVTGNNTTGRAQYVDVTATAPNGFFATARVFVEPAYTAPPTFSRLPSISPPSGGRASVTYALDMKDRDDRSIVTWYLCDDEACATPRPIAVSRDNVPEAHVALVPGFAGRYLRVGVRPRHDISEPGPEVFATAAQPIARDDVAGATITIAPRAFVEAPTTTFVSGTWNVQGTWRTAADDQYVGGYGIFGTSADASLVYQHDQPVERMSIRLVITPDKATGQSFAIPGSPADTHSGLNSDIYIKYDPRTKTGYSLRAWRTTQSATQVMFQFFRHVNGVSTPLDSHQVLTGVLKPNATLRVSVDGTEISADGRNETDGDTLTLRGTIEPNAFGGAGVRWPGSAGVNSRNIFSVIEIAYPDAAQGRRQRPAEALRHRRRVDRASHRDPMCTPRSSFDDQPRTLRPQPHHRPIAHPPAVLRSRRRTRPPQGRTAQRPGSR